MKKYFFKKTVKFVLRAIYQHCIALPVTLLYCIKKNTTEKKMNIVVCDHIGDALFTFGYLEEYKKANNVQELCVYCTDRFQPLLHYYPSLDCSYEVLSKKFLELLLLAYNCKIGQAVLNSFYQFIFVEPTNIFKMGFERIKFFPDISLKECIKYGAFELPKQCELVTPHIKKEESLYCQTKKQIIICPDAQIIDGREIWILTFDIGLYFQKQGYQVFINSKTQNECINGYQYVNWTLDEFFLNANQSAAVIGTRSGILDLAAFADTTVIALYPSDYDSAMMNFFDIKATNPENLNLYQYRLTQKTEDDIKKIIELFNNSKKQ